jgi:hypothetical protein
MTVLLIKWSRLVTILKADKLCLVFKWSGIRMPGTDQNGPFEYRISPVFGHSLCVLSVLSNFSKLCWANGEFLKCVHGLKSSPGFLTVLTQLTLLKFYTWFYYQHFCTLCSSLAMYSVLKFSARFRPNALHNSGKNKTFHSLYIVLFFMLIF